MKLGAVLRVLWLRRAFLAAWLVLAIIAGTSAAYRLDLDSGPRLESKRGSLGVASSKILVDAATSTVADLRPSGGSDVLDLRATLFATLIATEEVHRLLAAESGVSADELAVSLAGAPPIAPAPVADAAPRTADRPAPYKVNVSTQDRLPLITVETEAPDAAGAARLAATTFRALDLYLERTADAEGTPASRRPVISPFGRTHASQIVTGPGPKLAVALALIVFALGCALTLVVSGLFGSVQAARDRELRALASGQGTPSALSSARLP